MKSGAPAPKPRRTILLKSSTRIAAAAMLAASFVAPAMAQSAAADGARYIL
jgi:hypothetical protein